MTWAKPGDDIRKHLNARTVNNLLNKPVVKGGGVNLDTPVSEHIILNAWAATDITINEFDPVKITGPALNGNVRYRDVRVEIPGVQYSDWGVAQGTIKQKYSSQIVLKGITWANVEIIEDYHKYVDLIDGVLKTTHNGPAKLLIAGEMTVPENEEEEPEQLPSFIMLHGTTPQCTCIGQIVSVDYTDLNNISAQVTILIPPSDRQDLINRVVTVYDKACIFDEPAENLEEIKVWISWFWNSHTDKGEFFAINRCCT